MLSTETREVFTETVASLHEAQPGKEFEVRSKGLIEQLELNMSDAEFEAWIASLQLPAWSAELGVEAWMVQES